MSTEYRQNLRQASLNGFDFSCMVNTEDTVGRRGVLYEFPFRDTPKFFDLGRRAREHSITAHFFGDDHAQRSRAFKAICETPSPHTFIHPYCGTLVVAVRTATISNSHEHQRETIVTLDLVEFGAGLFPQLVGNTVTQLTALVSGIKSAISSDFVSTYSLANAPIIEQDQNINQLDSILSSLRESGVQNTTVNQDTAFSWLNIQAALASNGTTYFNNQSTIDLIENAVVNIYEYTDEEDSFDVLSNLVSLLQISVGGGSQVANDNNNIAIGSARLLAAIYAAQAALDNEFASFLDISSAITDIRTAILEELSILSQRCQYEERRLILEFLDNWTNLMLERGLGLPGVIEYQYSKPLPSLVIAHKLYGDCSRACEIEANNPNGFPLFMPERIQALSR